MWKWLFRKRSDRRARDSKRSDRKRTQGETASEEAIRLLKALDTTERRRVSDSPPSERRFF